MAFWDRISSRGNVEDRRSIAPAVGIGATGIILYLLFQYVTGQPIDVGQVLLQMQQIQVPQENVEKFSGEDSYEVFASKVLGSANDMWMSVFSESGKTYTEPKLILFRQATPSSCGTATSDVGPHYCFLDNTIYLDETFFDELTTRFGAEGGDVAEAYVIAHEVGHHAQNELGILGNVVSREDSDMSIKLELQADCFAGLWAHSISDLGVFEPGETQEALDAAAAVGDDRIQKSVQGYINPETWTHGSSVERVEWFNRGLKSGKISDCDTFH